MSYLNAKQQIVAIPLEMATNGVLFEHSYQNFSAIQSS